MPLTMGPSPAPAAADGVHFAFLNRRFKQRARPGKQRKQREGCIGLTVKVYEGTDSKTLAKGAGHFEETSIWRGNIAVAAHNRGTNNHFGKIHTLELGDEITLTTKLGTRTYEVVSVSKVLETDRSGLAATTENMITLYTCVMNQRDYRWCVKAVEI